MDGHYVLVLEEVLAFCSIDLAYFEMAYWRPYILHSEPSIQHGFVMGLISLSQCVFNLM